MNRSVFRRFFAFAAALPTAVALLSGCGGEEEFATNNSATNSATGTAAVPTDNAAPGEGGAGATAQLVSREEPATQPGKYGGGLPEAAIAGPKSFNLWVSSETSTSNAVGPLFEGLITLNAYTLQYEGRLAEMPKISGDGKVYTFTLKPNLKWSDGRPLTADDVIFTLDMIYDPKGVGIIREVMMVEV